MPTLFMFASCSILKKAFGVGGVVVDNSTQMAFSFVLTSTLSNSPVSNVSHKPCGAVFGAADDVCSVLRARQNTFGQ